MVFFVVVIKWKMMKKGLSLCVKHGCDKFVCIFVLFYMMSLVQWQSIWTTTTRIEREE